MIESNPINKDDDPSSGLWTPLGCGPPWVVDPKLWTAHAEDPRDSNPLVEDPKVWNPRSGVYLTILGCTCLYFLQLLLMLANDLPKCHPLNNSLLGARFRKLSSRSKI